MRKLLWGQLILIAAIFFISASDENPLSKFSPKQVDKLLKGEVIHQYEGKDEEGKTPEGAGTAYVIINAPVEQCWKIFTQFEKHYTWLPLLSASEVLERKDDKVVMHNAADFKIMTVHYTYTFTVDDKNHRAHFVTLPGAKQNDIKLIEGIYLFERIDDKRTLFTFTIVKLDIGFKVPRPILEFFATRNLPEVPENLKKRIESDGAWDKTKK